MLLLLRERCCARIRTLGEFAGYGCACAGADAGDESEGFGHVDAFVAVCCSRIRGGGCGVVEMRAELLEARSCQVEGLF